jgi:hypothetical protein
MISALMTLAFLAGIALLSFGAWLAYQPAGFLVAGLAFVLVPMLYVRGGSRTTD